MMRYRVNKGQSTLEYFALAICIIAALLVMQHYIKRGIEGKLREHADSLGEQYDAKHINSLVVSTETGTTDVYSRQVRDPYPLAQDGYVDGIRTTTTENKTSGRTGFENLQQFPGGLFD